MSRKAIPIKVRVDGVDFPCVYAVQAGMVTVWHDRVGSRSRIFSGELEEAVVHTLARELCEASRGHVGPMSAANR